MSNKIFCFFTVFLLFFTFTLIAAEYFVDSHRGSDQAFGTSEDHAWQSLERVNRANLNPGDIVRFARGGLWRGSLKPKSGTAGAPITYTCYGSDDLPKPRIYGSKSLNRPTDWVKVDTRLWCTVEAITAPLHGTLSDVGNLIFNGNRVGVKCWSKEQLQAEGHFWFDSETRCVWLVSVYNPTEIYDEIEAALRHDHIVNLINVHHVVISDFDVRYGAAHGICGGASAYITIRNCDISWIGGGHQFTRPDGIPVRYGNGIELWNNVHDYLIEGCRLWEIYDAALTNQGNGKNEQRNITYQNNVIWNCEYSFEYWNRPEESITDNITFMNNFCFNAGYGWGHTQRPVPNGRHLMFYANTAKTTNVLITNNVFSYATDSFLWVDNPITWTEQLFMNDNVIIQQLGKGQHLVRWQNARIYIFKIYQNITGKDLNSSFYNNWSSYVLDKHFAVHVELKAVYTPTLMLADLNAQLSDEFEWVNPSTQLSVGDNQRYQATYTDPSGIPEPVTGYITVNVAKTDCSYGISK